jgi:hypothetical protein
MCVIKRAGGRVVHCLYHRGTNLKLRNLECDISFLLFFVSPLSPRASSTVEPACSTTDRHTTSLRPLLYCTQNFGVDCYTRSCISISHGRLMGKP